MPAFQATGSSKPRSRQSGLQSIGAPAEPSGRRRWACAPSPAARCSRAFARERSISFCRSRTFFRSPSCVAVKIRCRSRRTSSSTRRQSTASQSSTSPSGPFTVHGVQLAHRFRHLQSAAPHRLTRPTSAPFRAGQHARIRPVMRQPFGGGPIHAVPGFLSPFGCRRSLLGSSCARWGVAPSSRSAYRRNRSAGPQRGCHVAHEQDSTGQGAPFTPGTVVRSRPATILRPAPAAFQRPVPTAPLTHPIGGGHLHEASSGVHSRSPITPRWPAATPEPEAQPLPAGLLLARDHRMERQPLRLRPRASHPAVTRRARRGGDRPFAHWPEYYTYGISRTSKRCLPLHSCTLMSHVVRGRLHGDLLDPLARSGDRPARSTAPVVAAHVPHLADPPPAPAGAPHAHLARCLGHVDRHTRSITSSCSASGISYRLRYARFTHSLVLQTHPHYTQGGLPGGLGRGNRNSDRRARSNSA